MVCYPFRIWSEQRLLECKGRKKSKKGEDHGSTSKPIGLCGGAHIISLSYSLRSLSQCLRYKWVSGSYREVISHLLRYNHGFFCDSTLSVRHYCRAFSYFFSARMDASTYKSTVLGSVAPYWIHDPILSERDHFEPGFFSNFIANLWSMMAIETTLLWSYCLVLRHFCSIFYRNYLRSGSRQKNGIYRWGKGVSVVSVDPSGKMLLISSVCLFADLFLDIGRVHGREVWSWDER